MSKLTGEGVIGRRYDAIEASYARLREEAEFTIKHYLDASGIKTHSVTSRLKTRDSYIAKASRRDGLDTLVTDLAGVRVVCLYLSDIEPVGQLLREHFDVLSEDNKIADMAVDVFGYMSVHYLAQFPRTMTGLRYDELHDKVFEVQVRTILMDAWANVSHHLDYKGTGSIPTNLRRDFYALSGLFYVADKQFQTFATQSESAAVQSANAVERGQSDLEINVDTVEALIRRRFPERPRADRSAIAVFAQELAEFGFGDLGDVDKSISDGLESALEDEKMQDSEKAAQDVYYYGDLGIARVSVTKSQDGYSVHLMRKVTERRSLLRRTDDESTDRGTS